MHLLTDDIVFPDVNEATIDGLLAVGGDLSVERLIMAYKSGIFPWFECDEPLLWWSPDPRFVLFPEALKVSKSMRKLFRNDAFEVTYNTAFETVISHCAAIKRQGQESTWITDQMQQAYTNLHQLGFAISVEVWDHGELVGGLYGVDLKNGVFCGESMFSKVSNASKYGFIQFVQDSNYRVIDCQIHTNHLESLGATSISRKEFIKLLN